jgi:transcriptional regulator with XRE-family HTH domain
MTNFEFDKVRARLLQLRNHLGKNQNEMGKTLGIGGYYAKIESGVRIPTDQVFVQIAEKLEINLDWLLHGTGESPIPSRLPVDLPTQINPLQEEVKRIKESSVPAISVKPAQLVTMDPEPAADPIVTVFYDSIKFVAQHQSGARIYITIIPPVETFTVDYQEVNLSLTQTSIQELIDLLNCAKHKVKEILP